MGKAKHREANPPVWISHFLASVSYTFSETAESKTTLGHGLSEMELFLWELNHSLLLHPGKHSSKQKEEEQVWASSIFILIADASATDHKIAMVKIIMCCEPFSSAQVGMSQSHTLIPRL